MLGYLMLVNDSYKLIIALFSLVGTPPLSVERYPESYLDSICITMT